MRKSFNIHSLEFKLSVIFSLLVFGFGSAQFVLVYVYWKAHLIESRQKLYWNVAEGFADEFRPLFDDHNLSHPKVKERLVFLRRQHPDFEIQFIKPNGSLWDAPGNHRIIQPSQMDAFLTPTLRREYPLYATSDPPGDRASTFSLAPTRIEGKAAFILVRLESKEYHATRRGVGDRILIIGGSLLTIIVAIATIIVGIILFRLVTKRLHILRSAVENYGAGNLSERVEVEGKDDVAILSHEFNRMASTINNNISELERSDRERRDLLAHIAHDLGAPVSAVRSFLEAIQDDAAGLSEERKNKLCNSALSSTIKIQRLCKDFLELSKLELSTLEANPQPFSILDCITEEIVPKLDSLAQELGCRVDLDIPEEGPLVLADEEMIDRVLTNLLENALRYGGNSGAVIIRAKVDESTFRVEICDQGEGLTPGELKAVFDRFYRSSRAREVNPDGSGLGLPAVKALLAAQRITIHVESEKNKGTRFYFDLPIYRADTQSPEAKLNA